MNFEEIKLAIAKIQFENLHLNADKTAIEANPSTHKIAEWVRDNFVPAETLVSGTSSEFTCKCGKMKGWITENQITQPCPSCGRKYKGEYSEKDLTIIGIEI